MGHQGARFPQPRPDPSNTVGLIQPDVIWCAQEERLQDKSVDVGASGEERLRKCFESLKKKKNNKHQRTVYKSLLQEDKVRNLIPSGLKMIESVQPGIGQVPELQIRIVLALLIGKLGKPVTIVSIVPQYK